LLIPDIYQLGPVGVGRRPDLTGATGAIKVDEFAINIFEYPKEGRIRQRKCRWKSNQQTFGTSSPIQKCVSIPTNFPDSYQSYIQATNELCLMLCCVILIPQASLVFAHINYS
jgi:hypothetical protein